MARAAPHIDNSLFVRCGLHHVVCSSTSRRVTALPPALDRHELAVKLERVEAMAVGSMIDALAPERRAAMQIELSAIAGTTLIACRAADYLLFNRAIGLGVQQAAVAADVEAIL